MIAGALLQELIDFQGLDWIVVNGVAAATPAEALRQRKHVNFLNTAIRWAWKEHDPDFAWPWTLDTDTVTPVDGVIASSDLGEGTWCSLWDADPRPQSACPNPVKCTPNTDGGALVVSPMAGTTVFAFFRIDTPQLEYADSGKYETPVIPDQLRHPILIYAVAIAMQSAAQNDEAAKYMASAKSWLDERMDGIGLSNPIWMRNPCAL